MDQSVSRVEEEGRKEGRETGKTVYNRSGSVPVLDTVKVENLKPFSQQTPPSNKPLKFSLMVFV